MQYSHSSDSAIYIISALAMVRIEKIPHVLIGAYSDGNSTAAMGVSTLDGLNPQGDGLHALEEHVVINSMPTRATLLAGMLVDWKF